MAQPRKNLIRRFSLFKQREWGVGARAKRGSQFNRPSRGILSQIFDFQKGDLINREHNIKHWNLVRFRNNIQAKYLLNLETDLAHWKICAELEFSSFESGRNEREALALLIQAVIRDDCEVSLDLINYACVTFIRCEWNYLVSRLTWMPVSAVWIALIRYAALSRYFLDRIQLCVHFLRKFMRDMSAVLIMMK